MVFVTFVNITFSHNLLK